MKTKQSFIFSLLLGIGITGAGPWIPARAQQTSDSTAAPVRTTSSGRLDHFSFNMLIDTYYTATINSEKDTSNVVPFSLNCPVRDEIRLNTAALMFGYNADNIRGNVAIQFGDAPNLLTSASSEWIQNIRQANFGFMLRKDLWVDLGYMISTVGYESLWAQLNQISFVTTGGYFEMGNVLGVKFSCNFSDKFSGGIVVGNPFTVAYSENTRAGASIFLTCQPLSSLSVSYNNYFGNMAPRNVKTKQDILYNNFIITWDQGKHLELAGQLDFAVQANSGIDPDTAATASMFSGFLQGLYRFDKRFSAAARYEFFNDPDGFLSGINKSTNRGLGTNGFTLSLECKPEETGYLRIAYRYLGSYPGSKAFYSNTSDQMQALYFTAGMMF